MEYGKDSGSRMEYGVKMEAETFGAEVFVKAAIEKRYMMKEMYLVGGVYF